MNVDPLRMTILVDDRAGERLAAEHVFAVFIETDGRRILFDTGPGAVVRANAERLGVDLDTVDTVILSHGHYDHSGGIPSVIHGRTDIDLYFHPAALNHRWSIDTRSAREVGIPAEALSVIRAMPGERLHRTTEASASSRPSRGRPVSRMPAAPSFSMPRVARPIQ